MDDQSDLIEYITIRLVRWNTKENKFLTNFSVHWLSKINFSDKCFSINDLYKKLK